MATNTHAQTEAQSCGALVNPGFEAGFDGWSVTDRGQAVALSGEAKSGERAAKITAGSGFVEQTVTIPATGRCRLSAQVRGTGVFGVKIGGKIAFDRPASRRFKRASVVFDAQEGDRVTVFLGHGGEASRYDDLDLEAAPGAELSPVVLRKASGGTGLSPDLAPSQNFDLSRWYLSVPTDTDGNGRADSIREAQLNAGYQDERFFFTAPDGGMTFRVPVAGARTSNNTKFTRTELREMLRAGDTLISTRREDGRPNANNWVLSSAPDSARAAAGAVDGVLEARLRVDHVTTTGDRHEVGRVIIGQIHAKDDEPIRLYYRKLPGHERGSVYFAHEAIGVEQDDYVELLGSRANNAPDPPDGIALGEAFSYRIETRGNTLLVTISQDGRELARHSYDMSESGYDVADDYMYFKAGVYNQNRSGDPDDYVQATFLSLSATHD